MSTIMKFQFALVAALMAPAISGAQAFTFVCEEIDINLRRCTATFDETVAKLPYTYLWNKDGIGTDYGPCGGMTDGICFFNCPRTGMPPVGIRVYDVHDNLIFDGHENQPC